MSLGADSRQVMGRVLGDGGRLLAMGLGLERGLEATGTMTPELVEAYRHALETDLDAQGAPIGEDREVPDYGGPEDRTTAGDVLVWAPRVMLFPLYVVTDFVVRRPLGFVVENIEEHHVLPRVIDATTFGDREGNGFNGGILPRLRLEREMRPALGAEIYLRDTLFPNNDWSVGADTDFRYNVNVDGGTSLSSRNGRLTAGIHGGFHRDGDLVFTGLGPVVDAEFERRFARDRLRGGLFAQYLPNVPGVGGRVRAVMAQNSFGCAPEDDSDVDICGPDSALGTSDDSRRLTGPDGLAYFASGYDLVSLGLDVFAIARKPIRRDGPAAASPFATIVQPAGSTLSSARRTPVAPLPSRSTPVAAARTSVPRAVTAVSSASDSLRGST